MRVSDSLKEGTSRFYAELLRLRRIVDMARKGPGVLFLLDEILHGTNTRERLIGARGVVRKLLEAGALGAVSTHDLALGDLEQEYEGRVTNVHFEEQVQGDVMTFDYVLRRGVVSSSNALRLMKAVGLEVE
jgi:DNA mismatch repair ATPase MutS